MTVYVPPATADRLMGRLTAVAGRYRWALSVRTDSAALLEADLAILDSGGILVARPRVGSAALEQARVLAAVLR